MSRLYTTPPLKNVEFMLSGNECNDAACSSSTNSRTTCRGVALSQQCQFALKLVYDNHWIIHDNTK